MSRVSIRVAQSANRARIAKTIVEAHGGRICATVTGFTPPLALSALEVLDQGF
jgi:hypothetical protein